MGADSGDELWDDVPYEGIVRIRPNLGRKRWALLGVILLTAGIVAAALYSSNKVTTTITPTGGLTLAGDFGSGYQIGTPKVTTWTITNNAGASVTAYLELNITKPGGGASGDVTVTIGGLPVSPTCGGTPAVCTYKSATFLILSQASTNKDTSLEFNVAATFTVTLQALGN